MSFKEYASAVAIGNRALAMVSESKTISSLDDPGLNAQAIRRWYKAVVARLLEMHHWGLATKRTRLVRVLGPTGNWRISYAAPDDMAFPVGLGQFSSSSNLSYYRGLGSLIASQSGRPIFEYKNGIIRSHYSGDLEYVSYDITEADFNATFEHIVTLMLASKLALEIPKDYDLSQDIAKSAMTEINLAITQSLNVGNRKYGTFASEADMARGTGGSAWDYVEIGLPREGNDLPSNTGTTPDVVPVFDGNDAFWSEENW